MMVYTFQWGWLYNITEFSFIVLKMLTWGTSLKNIHKNSGEVKKRKEKKPRTLFVVPKSPLFQFNSKVKITEFILNFNCGTVSHSIGKLCIWSSVLAFWMVWCSIFVQDRAVNKRVIKKFFPHWLKLKGNWG